jgi:hypothetical protein
VSDPIAVAGNGRTERCRCGLAGPVISVIEVGAMEEFRMRAEFVAGTREDHASVAQHVRSLGDVKREAGALLDQEHPGSHLRGSVADRGGGGWRWHAVVVSYA